MRREQDPEQSGDLRADGTTRQRGQALVIFVFAAIVMMGAAALATDASWLIVNQQRMQRAADAAALAGAVYLPGDPTSAFATAQAEASRNGYTNASDGVTITPSTDPANPRRLIVDIDQPVRTFFARVFCVGEGACLDEVDLGVQGRAEYVLPVPMGSPQNYYGVGLLRAATTSTTTVDDDTGWNSPNTYVSGQWYRPWYAYTNGYTTESSNGHRQDWRQFRFLNEIPNDPSVTIEGLRVRLRYTAVTGSGSYSSCRIGVRVSWNGGSSWSDQIDVGPLTTGNQDYYIGSSTSTSDWGSHSWTRSDLGDSDFRVRLEWNDGFSGCSSSRSVRVGEIEAEVDYNYESTSSSIAEQPVVAPDGTTLAPQNFWGAMQSQGAPSIQGDAFATYYDTRTSRSNDDYDPAAYYQYAVEIPSGASNGEIWLYDPGFCHVDSDKGVGESWNTGSSYGYTPSQPVSAFYDLWDTQNTTYHTSDDSLVTSSGSTFKRLSLRDQYLDVSNPVSASDCSGLTWHNGWWKLAGGLAGNRTYRIHAYSTDPDSSTDQRNTTALNAFAIWSSATGGTPRVYGLGAMEAYVRLPGGLSSEFYLAQIDAEHAGKTMLINLWDPGDTGNLAANLQILKPTASNYQPATFSYSARRGSSHSNTSSCDSRSGTNVTSVTTNTGGSSRYNGCWLTIEIPLPSNYSAPNPTSDTVTNEGGWWKIRYNMSGSTSSNSTDLTTWQVELRGSPVHLVIP